MKLYALLLIAITAGYTGCKQSHIENGEVATFVLSDTTLASIRIDTTVLEYREGGEMLAIPSSAVIFDKGKNFVLVFRDKYNVDIREVKVDESLNEVSYISRGLQPGEKVISKNQLPIYDALNN